MYTAPNAGHIAWPGPTRGSDLSGFGDHGRLGHWIETDHGEGVAAPGLIGQQVRPVVHQCLVQPVPRGTFPEHRWPEGEGAVAQFYPHLLRRFNILDPGWHLGTQAAVGSNEEKSIAVG